ncbi:MAG TPA: MarP family serine protease [Acidimicrobiales bacterium]|nr:MarP family serine protease [Acidimicrobiales bacterium]
MNSLDIAILLAAVGAGFGAWRLGFLARVASWVGLAAGLVVAARFLPTAVEAFDKSDPTSKLLVAGVVLLGGAFIGQGLGLLLGSSLRRFVPIGPLRMADSAVGALVGVLGVLVMVWLLLPAIADVPGSVSRTARQSAIARFLDRALPPPPDTMQALRRVVGETNFPKVFEALRPAPVTGPPPATIPIPQATQTRVAASTVRIAGVACSRIQEGSGFVVGTDTVVTNAHVVAGHRPGRTQVERTDGRTLEGTVVVFDPARDLAVIKVPGLDRPALPVGNGEVGDQGAVFGHPGGQEQLRIAPAAVREKVNAVGRDLYDSRQTRRDVFILASALRPGDSGAALVNQAGQVIGVAFAIAPDQPGTAYALTSKELRADLAVPRGGAVETGPCLNG